MFYEGEEDILTAEQRDELIRQGFLPGQPYEQPDSLLSDYEENTFTADDLAQIDAIADSDCNAPAQAPSTIIGPLTLVDTFREETKARTGFYPHSWQVDIAVALYEGSRDVLLIAGTGYGKTLPLVMNNFLDKKLITWIASPLNYIEMEQARVFSEDWKLKAVAVNSMTSRLGLIDEIKRGDYQVVISSIESMTASNKLRPALGSRIIANRRHILVIDEAHCISSWSESDFRPLYATVGRLRRILPAGTPVAAATATANKQVRSNIQNTLAFRENPLVANLGNFRSNLIHIVHRLKGSASAVEEILQYFKSKTKLPLALVFVNSRSMGQKVLETLTNHVDPSMRGAIQFYHAHLDDFHKKVLTEGFRLGKFCVLVTTESLTM
ncbi:hypothetical protein FRC11_002264, partial [Ceratobasidium sp. 423]